MKKIYRTDDGHEMGETDFLAYLLWKVDAYAAEGLNKADVIDFITKRDFWGDSIVDESAYERVIEILLITNQIVIT